MKNSRNKRNILLIEPNYKNKYPPIGLMKISTFHRGLGDDVRFHKGNLKHFVVNEIVDHCIRRLENAEDRIDWTERRPGLKAFIQRKDMALHDDGKILASSNWPLIEENLRYYRNSLLKRTYDKFLKWDRVYITTLFTFHWKVTVDTINFCKIFVRDNKDLWLGGVMATLIPNELEEATGIKPFTGLLDKPCQLDRASQKIVDKQPLDYSILDEIDYEYPFANAYFTYMTKGCKNKCSFCAVPTLEPAFNPKIPTIRKFNYIKMHFGDQKNLCLIDNNVLASDCFPEIIDEIKRMGFRKGATFNEPNQLDIAIYNLKKSLNDRAYIRRSSKLLHELLDKINGKNAQKYYDILEEYRLLKLDTTTKENLISAYDELESLYEQNRPKRRGLRWVDFNQGVDCRFVTDKKMKLMSEIPIRPLRIAFDHLKYQKQYRRAVELAAMYGIRDFSNYILYNFNDTPDDLYRRLEINMELCKELDINIYSFPMKYIPIKGEKSKDRSYTGPHWNYKFIGAIQAILNVTKGIVAPPSRRDSGDSFFKKAFGKNLDEFHELLYMPEPYIVYRKLFEKDLQYTAKWQSLFRAVKKTKQFVEILPIIEQKNFASFNGNFRGKRIRNLIKHYFVTRDDAALMKKDIQKFKDINTILRINGRTIN